MAADPELCLAAYSYVADPPHGTARDVAKIMNWDLRTAKRYIADGRELDRRLVEMVPGPLRGCRPMTPFNSWNSWPRGSMHPGECRS